MRPFKRLRMERMPGARLERCAQPSDSLVQHVVRFAEGEACNLVGQVLVGRAVERARRDGGDAYAARQPLADGHIAPFARGR